MVVYKTSRAETEGVGGGRGNGNCMQLYPCQTIHSWITHSPSPMVPYLAHTPTDNQPLNHSPTCPMQAVMELGATVCLGTGGAPKCSSCPLREQCGAYMQLQKYLAQGGHLEDAAAPLVTTYPTKVRRMAS